ncbi:MAG: FtsX-like permease family protein [Lachnospiraceae bacterium]|nr:FtsX-like permease family protein [Lachnospiraceae bacterium]
MRQIFYPKLAASGMYKNRKIYLPYLLTCIGMVMMHYIIGFLTVNEGVAAMQGGDTMQMTLSLGTGVVAVFAMIFLFYTNSFLIRRRKKEFGLYNILGMGKWNLFRVMFWESFFCGIIALLGGLGCGILLSKAAELSMAKVLGETASLHFSIEYGVIGKTVVLFAVIFGVILLNSVRQIYVSKPVELMHSEAAGEKPPKANWFLALAGVGLLGVAYYLAVTIQNPMTAMVMFFVAVILVILGTYLLFMAGSVAFCRLLQKRKGYYYKTNHFVSVSSMAFRMKRNGAGLASICILSTMVLVMISSTACLYIGKEENLRNRYPRNMVIDTFTMDETYAKKAQEEALNVVKEHGLLAENVLHYRYLGIGCYMKENQVILDIDKLESFGVNSYENVIQLYVVPLSDYNKVMGKEETLEQGQILMYCAKMDYQYDTIEIEGCGLMKVKEKVSEFIEDGDGVVSMIPSLYLFVPDDEVMQRVFEVQSAAYGDNSSFYHDFFGFDLNCSEEEKIQVGRETADRLHQLTIEDEAFPHVDSECAAAERNSFYALYGGMFFLGILLGLVFILAAVLIIYYKQISEGYEDQSRFDIMQKVGMTKREIRKSVNSQVLTVFFLPLITAGIHLGFAFPILLKILMLFGLLDKMLLIQVAVGSYLIFALFYVLVYRITSRLYYGIITVREK